MTADETPPRPTTALGWLISTYALIGVLCILSAAVARLAPKAWEPFGTPLAWYHWAAYAFSVVFMAYSEGYKGFQLQFSPRVVTRAFHLGQTPHPAWSLLAPFVAMGLVHATRKRMIISWSLTSGIIVLVLLVRMLAQPWRGVVDAGVVVGLTWGLVSILVFWARALGGRVPQVPADMPASA